MRIAIISTPFIRVPPAGYGGTELFCYELAEGLTRRGHSVTLFTTGDSITTCKRRWLYDEPIWPPSTADDANHLAWAYGEVAEGEYDVMHINSSLGIAFAQLTAVPVVYTIHHRQDEAVSRVFADHPEIFYVAISRRQLDLEIPLPAARVIHHGLRPERYPPSLRDEGYTAHIGRYAAEKGTHLAIDASLAAGLPIRLAGRAHPSDKDYYEKEIAPRLKKSSVIDLGEVDHDQKIAILKGARALFCPIQWEEPFGLVAIEAMLSGTPVIGFPRGSFPEIVDPNITGFLVAEGDLQGLARAAAGLARFDRRACARHARARFNADKMVAAYEAAYLRAISLHASRKPRAA